ncbi:MAG: LysR family transcriptional regulator [Deltaproteobacteria bacterium]|nr:LysR family transcriptional regulator [Deltaproteobacteria bacterium]
MINLNQLRVFYHAAKHQNFTRASEDLHITQPGVTAQARLFEETCGLVLFKKKGRRIFLTDEGKILFDYARRVFETEGELENAIEELRALKRGILRLGTTKAYARYFMPVLITSYHQQYPNIRINLNEGSSRDMILSLLDFRNEIAVIARADDHPDVAFTPFSQEELVLIVPPGHPWTQRRAVRIEELALEPIIMKDIGSGTRRVINDLFTRSGYEPNVLMETSNTEFIKDLVHRGEAVSFLVRESVAAELRAGRVGEVPLEGTHLTLDVSIAHLKDQHLSPAAKAYLDLLHGLSASNMPYQGIGAIMASMLARRKQDAGAARLQGWKKTAGKARPGGPAK